MGLKTSSRRPTFTGQSSMIYSLTCHRLLCFTIFLFLMQQPFGTDGLRNRRKSKSSLLRPASVKGEDVPCNKEQIGKEVFVRGISGPVPRNPYEKIVCTCIYDAMDLKTKLKCAKEENRCAKMLQGCHYYEDAKPDSNCEIQCRGCVASNGTRYESGQSWMSNNGGEKCVHNVCFSGVITASHPLCPPVWCANPLNTFNSKASNSCTRNNGGYCPSCAGCSKDGVMYREGETKQDPEDPCNECSCKGGNLTCTRKICPVLPCPANLIRSPPGKCCPECVRKQTFTRIKNMCKFRDRVYKVGSKYNISVCTECTCMKGQTTVCKKTTCPKLKCPLYQQRRVSGACCAHCRKGIGLIEAGIKPTTAPKPVTKIPDKKCKVGGNVYGSETAWKSGPNGCQQCVCVNGVTKCTEPSCTINTKEDCPLGADLEYPKDECCPKCNFRPGVCTVFGDPHYKTFDGRIFNFQGSCKYLLSKECDKAGDNSLNGKNSSFSVRITNDARNSSGFSWTRTITVRLKSDKISLMQNRRDGQMRVKINGKRIDVNKAYIKIGFYSMIKEGYRLVLRTNEGISVLWDGVSFLEMTVPPKYRNRLCGLCGNFNGDTNDDFNGRHGKSYESGLTFGNSWRVGGYRACSIHPQDMSRSIEPKHNCSQSWNSRINSDRYCNAIHSTMFEKCARKIKIVRPEYYFNACKLDMCECPTDQCHCEVLTAYARECENLGLSVQGWREATNCEKVSSYKYGKRRNKKNGLNKIGVNNLNTNDVLGSSENVRKTSWISSNTEPNDIGKILAGYSPKQATKYIPKRRFLDRAIDYKHLLTPKERKRIRNQEKRRKRKQLRRERKRKRRLQRKRRRQRERKRNNAKKRKMQELHKSELKRLGDEVGLDVVESKDQSGAIKRRLNWTKFKQTKKTSATRNRPPFEELLSGSFLDSTRSSGHDFLDDVNKDEDYQEYDNLLDYNSAIIQDGFIPNNVNGSTLTAPDLSGLPGSNHSDTKYDTSLVSIPIRKGKNLSSRTPLPLFDTEHEPYKRRAKPKRHSRSTSSSDRFYDLPQIKNLSVSNYHRSTKDRIRQGTKVHFN